MLQNIVDFKAKSFLSERNTSTMAYEVKSVRALWDPSLSIPGTNRRGGWRCPVGTRYGGQITDRFGRSCGWGVARRIANQISDIGQRLENVDDVRRGERIARRERRILNRLNPQDRGSGRLEQGLRGIAERLEGGETGGLRNVARGLVGQRRRTVVARPPSVDTPEALNELTPAPRAPRRRRAPNLRESEQRRIDREIEQPGAPRTAETPVRPTRPIPNRDTPALPRRDDKDPYVENLRTMSDEDLEKQYQDAQESVERLRDAVDKPRDDGMIGMLPVSAQRLSAKRRLDAVNAELNRRGKKPPQRRRGNLRDSEARRMERELVQPGAPRTGEAPARRRRRAVVEATQKPKAPTRREEQREITPVNFEGMNEVDLQPIPEGIRNMTDQEIETELRKKGGVSRERTQFLLREQAARKLRAEGKDKPAKDKPKIVKPRRPKPEVNLREPDLQELRRLDAEENKPKRRKPNPEELTPLSIVEQGRDVPQPPPPRPNLLPPAMRRGYLVPEATFKEDRDQAKINDALNNVNFDIINNYDNMQNFNSANLDELKDLLAREKRLQVTLEKRLRNAGDSWLNLQRDLGAEDGGRARDMVRDRYLIAWAAQQGSEEKIKQMEFRKVEIEANIEWRRRPVPQRNLVNDPLDKQPQPQPQPAGPRRFNDPKLAEEFKIIEDLNYSEVNAINSQYQIAKNQNPVIYTSANLQDGVYGDVEALNQIIASNSEKASDFNNQIRDAKREVLDALEGEERQRAIQKLVIAIQGRERMYEENRVINAVIQQNPFGIEGARPDVPVRAVIGADQPIADIDDPELNNDVNELLDSSNGILYLQAKELYKTKLQTRLDEFVNWERSYTAGLFNGDFGGAAQIATRIEQAEYLRDTYQNTIKEQLEIMKQNIGTQSPISAQLENIADAKAKLVRVKLEERLLKEFQEGKLAPLEAFKVGEPKGIVGTPEQLRYRPTPVEKMLDPIEEKLLEQAVLKISDVKDLSGVLAVIDENKYDVAETQQRLEMAYVDNLSQRVAQVADGRDVTAAVEQIRADYRYGNDSDDLARIEEARARILDAVEKLEKLSNEDNPSASAINRAVSEIGRARISIAEVQHGMRQRNSLREDFDKALLRLQEGYFVDPKELEAPELTSEKLKSDIDTSIEKAVAKRASEVETYLESQFPDYGGDPEDSNNMLPDFVRMTPEKWGTLSNEQKEGYLREAYTFDQIVGANGKFYRTRVQRFRYNPDETIIDVEFDEVDEDGRVVRERIAASTRRLQMNGNPPSVYQQSFFISKNSDKGAGLATVYNGVAFRYLEKIGVKQAQVSPAEDGQYIWARVGFKNEEPLDSYRMSHFKAAMRTYEVLGGSGLITTDEEYQRVKAFVDLQKSGVPLSLQDAVFMMDSGGIQEQARRDYIKHWFIEHMPLYSGAALNFADNKIGEKSAYRNIRRKNLLRDRAIRYKRLT